MVATASGQREREDKRRFAPPLALDFRDPTSRLNTQAVTAREFDNEMAVLLNAWGDWRAFQPLRVALPHYPMSNGFTDELTEFGSLDKIKGCSQGV